MPSAAKTLHPTHRRRPYRGGDQASSLNMLDCSTAGAGGGHQLSPRIQIRVHTDLRSQEGDVEFQFRRNRCGDADGPTEPGLAHANRSCMNDADFL